MFIIENVENTNLIPEKEVLHGQKGMELSREPVELNSGDWKLNIVPWIGGRILSMTHVPSGNNLSTWSFCYSSKCKLDKLCTIGMS